MSSALASARKRSIPQPPPPTRAPTNTRVPPPAYNSDSRASSDSRNSGVSASASSDSRDSRDSRNSGNSGNNSAMTLPQIIDIYGRRILQLEKTLGSGPVNTTGTANPINVQEVVQEATAALENRWGKPMDELNARYELLAQEIHSLKDIVLHLQDYTMSVNQRLLEGAFAPPPLTEASQTFDDLQEDIQFLQAQLEKTPEEYELNPGI